MVRFLSVSQLCERLPRVLPIVRPIWVKTQASHAAVVVIHRSTGRYLAEGGEWIPEVGAALQFAEADGARWMIERHACEIPAFELYGELGDELMNSGVRHPLVTSDTQLVGAGADTA